MKNKNLKCINPKLGILLNKFINGTLTESQMERVEYHIFFDCEKCFKKYQFYIDLKTVIREAYKKGLIKLKN